MLQQLNEEKVNALTKLADLIGKQPLVILCMISIAFNIYLINKVDTGTDERIKELKESQRILIDEIKGVKSIQDNTKEQVDSLAFGVKATVKNVERTLDNLNNKKR